MSNLFNADSNTRIPAAELFHENSKLPPRIYDADGSPWLQGTGAVESGDVQIKTYRTAKKTKLPPRAHLGEHVSDVLGQRRSVRTYGRDPVTLWQVGQLLGWGHGTASRPGEALTSGRTAPSAGALYPIEIYVAAQAVAELPQAIYHYNAQDHLLETVATEETLETVHRASLYPEIVGHASLYLIMAAAFARTCRKYGERGYRFVLLDCGHVAQNLHLIATAVGLGSVGIGGFLDDPLNELLELDGVNEAVIHTMALGPIT
jgi:SagB-type dehydrogenase family enzyme